MISEKTHDKRELFIAFREVYLRGPKSFIMETLAQRSEMIYSRKIIGGMGTETLCSTGSTGLFTSPVYGQSQILMTTLMPVSVIIIAWEGGAGEKQRCFHHKIVETPQSWLLLLFLAGCKEKSTCWHRGVKC